ncbi:MAG: ABC transporter permease, partial [Chitinophagaceae bacterium]|nr:ABC transporter permease [Chitinophagaceae bacterium]
MNKILIIIKREYLTRVRNKTFLLSTFLLPLVMIAFIGGSAYLGAKSLKQYKIAVKDETNLYKNKMDSSAAAAFSYPDAISINDYKSRGYDAILIIYSNNGSAPDSVRMYSEKELGLATDGAVRKQLQKINEEKLLLEKGVSRAIIDSIRTESENEELLNFRSYKVKGAELKEGNKKLSSIVGFISGIIIYITLFIYGASVMRGVMEEKMNRIAEVMVSSVKPFQLMLGKIIGIAAVGLTQLLLWIALIMILSSIFPLIVSPEMVQNAQQANEALPGAARDNTMLLKMAEGMGVVATGVNWFMIIGLFLFYF